eukprot:GSChrysophyteH1.ASY1.ANO1.1219.1 assembled CDS
MIHRNCIQFRCASIVRVSLLLLIAPSRSQSQYSGLDKAPSWYRNFPPWWITAKKLPSTGYTNQLVAVSPIIAPRSPPPQTVAQGYPELKKFMENRIVPPPGTPPQIKEGMYDTSYKGSTNSGDQIYKSIMSAGGTERAAPPELKGAIADLADPTFAAVSSGSLVTKHSPLTFIQLAASARWLEPDKDLSYYNHNTPGYRRSWDPDNKDQVYPLWDSYWEQHPNIMPSLQNHYISRNAFFNYKDSPINLYYRATGYSRPSNLPNVADQKPIISSSNAPDSSMRYDSDSSW